ncbi:family 43 glycosylhydrolase [Bacteroides sp. OttesenSCG-928-D19]|nr:family 43 glycosylhydrolase [Bacteroides sp. OttesenSCG-928-D19]
MRALINTRYAVALLLVFAGYGSGLSSNPIIKRQVHGYYAADPSAHVWVDGRLYIYASRDVEPPRGCDLMDGYRVYSTDDMVTWTDHGEILHSSQVSWGRSEGGFMWAPDCAYKDGTYYFYFPHPTGNSDWNTTWKIGVATSTKPASDFKVQGYIKGLESLIDPCVFVDDDGKAYIYHGGGGRCMGGELADDMMSIKGSMKLMEGLSDFHEAPWVHKYNGKYYLSHSDNNSNGGNNMRYAMSDNPLGPWKDMGVYMYPVGSETAHGSIVEYKDQWYAFYHASYSGDPWLRSACVDPLFYNADGSIQLVKRREYGTPYKEHILRETHTVEEIALTLEAEDYNLGGEGIGYHDTDDINKPDGNYRPGEGVDLDSYGPNEYSIGFTDNGEWTQYTIYVEKSGLYDIECIVASDNDNGRFHLKFNEQNLTGDITFKSTGGWSVWSSVFARNILLRQGENYMKFYTNGSMNIDKFIFRKSAPYSGTPYKGRTAAVPGKVEAENYDEGGLNVAYFDTTPTNQGGATYRNDAVDIQTNSGGYHISHTEGGEWLKYTLDVRQSGIYNVECRISVGNASGSFHIEIDNMDTYPVVSQSTTGWETFVTLTVKDVYLTKGTHVMKFAIGGGINIDYYNFVRTGDIVSVSPPRADGYEVAVYPNPSNGVFAINVPQAGNLKIVDMEGRLVYTGRLNASVNYVDISGNSAGVYVAVIEINGKTQQVKLVKK